jgi:hypothetical protein
MQLLHLVSCSNTLLPFPLLLLLLLLLLQGWVMQAARGFAVTASL